jgi:hypothetical protein
MSQATKTLVDDPRDEHAAAQIASRGGKTIRASTAGRRPLRRLGQSNVQYFRLP